MIFHTLFFKSKGSLVVFRKMQDAFTQALHTLIKLQFVHDLPSARPLHKARCPSTEVILG